jgi:O-antigen/teichoic acid export membrane protein
VSQGTHDDHAEIHRQLSRIARGGAVNLIGAVVSALSSFAFVVVVTNNFDSATAGMLFSATSAFLILAGIAMLGTDAGLARFLLRSEVVGRSSDVRTCIRIARRPVVFTSVGLAIVAFAAADWLAPIIGLASDDGPTVLRLLAAVLPAAVLSDFSLSATRALGRMRTTVLVEKTSRALSQPLGAAIVAGLGGGLVWLAIAWGLPYVAVVLVSIYLLGRQLRDRQPVHRVRLARARVLSREFWKFTWPRGVARASQIALQRADIVIVAALLSPLDAAVYTAATRFVVLGQFGVQAVQQVLQPQLSRLLARQQQAVVRDIFQTSTAWSIALAWPLYVLTACAAPLYLEIFGFDYSAEGTVVVVVMALAMLLATAAGPVDTLLLMSGRSMLSLANNVAALVIDVALCFALIPAIGIAGAAVAWATAIVVKNALAFVQVRMAFDFGGLGAGSVRMCVANVVCFALPVLMLTLGPGLSWLGFALVASAGGVCYGYLIWRHRRLVRLAAFRSLRGA